MLQLCVFQATGNAVTNFFGRPLLAYLVGILSVVALYVIAKVATGGTIRKLYDGADGRQHFQVPVLSLDRGCVVLVCGPARD